MSAPDIIVISVVDFVRPAMLFGPTNTESTKFRISEFKFLIFH